MSLAIHCEGDFYSLRVWVFAWEWSCAFSPCARSISCSREGDTYIGLCASSV